MVFMHLLTGWSIHGFIDSMIDSFIKVQVKLYGKTPTVVRL